MQTFLTISGIGIIFLGAIASIYSGIYGLIVFPIIFSLGCIVLGISRIISLLEKKQ